MFERFRNSHGPSRIHEANTKLMKGHEMPGHERTRTPNRFTATGCTGKATTGNVNTVTAPFGVQMGLPRLASVRMRPHQFDSHYDCGKCRDPRCFIDLRCCDPRPSDVMTLDTPLTRGPGAAQVRRNRARFCENVALVARIDRYKVGKHCMMIPSMVNAKKSLSSNCCRAIDWPAVLITRLYGSCTGVFDRKFAQAK
jgi:hypothetical protein